RLRDAVRIGPRVLLAASRQPAHVRPVPAPVVALDLLVADGEIVVPLLVLGDAEVDERPVPDVGEAHDGAYRNPVRGRETAGRSPRSVAEEDAADANQRRALLDRDTPILRRPHRELREPVALRQLAQAPEPRSRRLWLGRKR